jgi:serine/threonine-protein kinase
MAVLGSVIGGRYRLDAVIGRGGMSTVYRARDSVLERVVAIKLMHSSIAADSAQLERFRREARLVAQLSHPNVVTVIDAGEQPEPGAADGEGTPYIVFECVEGETLKDLIRREGPLAIPVAIAYAIEIARALGAAHERHLVHRDVKPQNVLISSEGAAKITDFGIARPLTEAGLTGTGRVLATTDYIAPEQALGQPVSAQSDIYSLGIVLYEMLTGDVPFHGESPVGVAMRHVREQLPDVQLAQPQLSAATAAVVDRATMKDPDDRYRDAAGMVAELEQALALETARAGQPTSGEVTSVLRTLPGSARSRLPLRVRRPGAWLGAFAVVALAVALVLVFVLGRTHRGVGAGAHLAGGAGGGGTLTEVSLAQSAAHSYNPFGTGPENLYEVGNVIDGDPETSWSTERYFDGTLQKEHGLGTGLYLDAAPRVKARAIGIQTSTPGFPVQVYVAEKIEELPYGQGAPLGARGWHGPVGSDASVQSGARIELELGGRAWRYYLIWLTGLPPGAQDAVISELALFR